MLFGFNPTKAKTQCKLGVSRIKLMRNKRQIVLKGFYKEVAELLRANKQGNARIRVEAVIREHSLLQAYEILELYLELIGMRCELMQKHKVMPADMMEAICSVVYAGQRVSTDLTEVTTLRKMLVDKYQSAYSHKDQDFAAECSSDAYARKWLVNDKLIECLKVEAPPPDVKIKFLTEIAAEYDVAFDANKAAADMLPGPAPPAYAPVVPAFAASPPMAAADAAAAAAAEHAADVLSAPDLLGGTSVVIRPTAGVQAPPAASPAAALPPGWAPPPPQDTSGPGRTIQAHMAAAGSWMQAKQSGGGSSGISSASSPGGKPASPAGSYQDASAAAEAAKRYSDMARAAAEAAEQYARSSGGASGGGGGGGGGGGMPLAHRPGGLSDEEYQRVQAAYDAAPGAATKGEISDGPPSAPLVDYNQPPPAAAAPPPTAAPLSPGLTLPSPPKSAVGRSGGNNLSSSEAAATPPPPADPLDELTARFEALKRR